MSDALNSYRGLQRRLWRLWRAPLARIDVVANPRLRTTVARYRPAFRRLEVSQAAARSGGLQRILVHELAHAAAVALHGRGVRPHGKEWKALVAAAERAGFAARQVNDTRCAKGITAAKRPTASRFAHACLVCQFRRIAKRRVTTWRCPDCYAGGLPGLLAIEKLR